MSVPRRLLVSALIVATIGGFSLAVAGEKLLFGPGKPLALASKRSISIRGLAPGDRAQRLITVRNRTRQTVRTVRFRIARPTHAVGRELRVSLATCTKKWVRQPTIAESYRCPGVLRAVMTTRHLPVNTTLRKLRPIRPGARVYFRMTTLMRRSAGNRIQGARVTLRPSLRVGSR